MTISRFQSIILAWYKHNRRDLPWRKTKDPYKILVSEVMLQQTQVSRVLPKYKEFLKEFPTITILARARIKKLLKVWAGLGYWRRALYLKETAKILAGARAVNSQTSPRRRFGMVPAQRDKSPRAQTPKPRRDFEGRSFGISLPEQLEKLPGIGPYTARAVACFAFGNKEAFLDTNIRRVYLHFFFPKKKNVSDKAILKIAQKSLSKLHHGELVIGSREWHYALMDYGAMVLKDKKINRRSKHYAKQSKFKGSFRSFRTKVMRFLLSQPKYQATHQKIKTLLTKAPYPPTKILASLLKDRLIKKKQNCYTV